MVSNVFVGGSASSGDHVVRIYVDICACKRNNVSGAPCARKMFHVTLVHPL